MTPQEFEKIKEAAEEFFKQTGLLIEVDVKSTPDSTVLVDLKTEEPQFLIGEKGQNLSEIQRLLKAVLRKKTGSLASAFYVDVDINDYKKKKLEYLKEMAKDTADEVSITGREKELPSMSPYERRIVHVELASRTDIATESVGQEPERRVRIRPRSSH